MDYKDKWLKLCEKYKEQEKYQTVGYVFSYELDDLTPTNMFIKKHDKLLEMFRPNYDYLLSGLVTPFTICCFFDEVIDE